jgi:hypothetical protein
MGAFYGSVQVRSEDRDRVKAAAEEVALQRHIRMLIGPVLDGWIGVYPEGSGQFHDVSRELAQRINDNVMHFLVHDDDIFAYWLYREGQTIDSFHSRPGYFGNESRAEEEGMVGDADAFQPLMGDRVEQIRPLLVRDGRPWESDRLNSFAKVLGISNALTSYEYLKEGDHHGIKSWRKFEEIPVDEIANAKERKRQAKELLKSDVKRLKADGLLIDRKVSRDGMPYACGLAQDVFVAWTNLRTETVSFSLCRAPRKSPERIPLNVSDITRATVSDAQGRRVAMAVRGRVQVWDFAATKWRHVCDIAAPGGVSGLAISSDGKLVAHSSRMQTFVTDVGSGRRLLEIPDHKFEQGTFHPSGEWMAVGRPDCALITIHKEPHWRPLVQKPKAGAEWPLAKAARLLKIDVGTLIERCRRFDENLTSLARQFSGFEDPSVVEARLEKHREEQAAKVAQMEADWAAIQRGEPLSPAPVHGTWSIGFSHGGRWLWRGTASGLFVYEWSAVGLEKAPELPDPTWSFELPSVDEQPFRSVYAVAEEPDAHAVVFGGMTGRLYHLDLESGRVRQLIKLPGDCHIQTLAFSNDGTTLAIAAKAYPLSRDYIEEGTIWEVWNYPHLRDGGAVVSEAD